MTTRVEQVPTATALSSRRWRSRRRHRRSASTESPEQTESPGLRMRRFCRFCQRARWRRLTLESKNACCRARTSTLRSGFELPHPAFGRRGPNVI